MLVNTEVGPFIPRKNEKAERGHWHHRHQGHIGVVGECKPNRRQVSWTEKPGCTLLPFTLVKANERVRLGNFISQ